MLFLQDGVYVLFTTCFNITVSKSHFILERQVISRKFQTKINNLGIFCQTCLVLKSLKDRQIRKKSSKKVNTSELFTLNTLNVYT